MNNFVFGLSTLFGRIKVFEIFGVTVYFSWLFILLLSLITASGFIVGSSATILYVSVLYISLILHEFGHSITAKYFGYRADDITIYPYMGVAYTDIPWDNPKAEFWIALNGPLVSLGLSLLFFPLFYLTQNPLIGWVSGANLALFAFNMIVPVLPMDGGRVLKSVLGFFFSPISATRMSVAITVFIYPAFFFAAFYLELYHILFISPFLMLFAAVEYANVFKEHDKISKRRQALRESLEQSLNVNFVTFADEKTKKIFYDIAEFNHLVAEIVVKKFFDLKSAQELVEIANELSLNKIFVNEDQTYKTEHPNWKEFEEYWVAPYSRRKYIVKKIVEETLERKILCQKS